MTSRSSSIRKRLVPRSWLSLDPAGLASVQVSLPVWRNAAGRAVLVHLTRLIVPEPGLAGLEAADERVPGSRGVRAGMLRRGGVTAANMPALSAPAQVNPPALAGVALGASGTAGRDRWIESRYLRHLSSLFPGFGAPAVVVTRSRISPGTDSGDRKSTRLNSSHVEISYAVFCL